MNGLAEILIDAAREHPDALAVVAPDGQARYAELDFLADRSASALVAHGVQAGDRVGVYAKKGLRPLALMQGALRLGAAYVPVDPQSPPSRACAIFEDCRVTAVVTDLPDLLTQMGPGELADVPVLRVDDAAEGWAAVLEHFEEPPPVPPAADDALAFILYTSGSTGTPKGVCISHRNALAFVTWAVECVGGQRADRFANHAPFNFDLSVFDIYGAFLSRARLVIVLESEAYFGNKLVEFCRDHAITVWYSVPTALGLMLDQIDFNQAELPHLRTIVFAGEVFPIKPLRELRARFPKASFFNYYGPTETNVCTFYEVTEIPADRTSPVPIGTASCGDRVWARTEEGREARPGEEGELIVEGPTVMLGYWGKPPQGTKPYETGDIVRVLPDGMFDYVGRTDNMVKIRGWRVEIGEVESVLLQHESVTQAAVVLGGAGTSVRLVAFVVLAPGAISGPSLLAMKSHCAARLPPYMNISRIHYVGTLPRTSNGKIDRKALRERAESGD